MASRIPTYAELFVSLEEAYNEAFPSPELLRQYGIDPVVWTEGGEWPAFNELFKPIAGLKEQPLPDADFTAVGAMDSVGELVAACFASCQEANFSMDCGAGKSTKLVLNLHRAKIAYSTIVVEPSVVVAKRLAEHVSTIADGIQVRSGLEGDRMRKITYVSAGQLLAYLLLGGSLETDLVLLDEAHAVTSVYRTIRSIVKRMDVKFVQMTASVGSGVRGPRAARTRQVNACDSTVSAAIAESPAHAAVVGVTENGQYAVPANMLIGATTDLRVVYDTGLRPDPIATPDQLTTGERVATQLEITQMAGRVGRTSGNTGHVYYNDQASAISDARPRLYDILYEVLMAIAGLPSAYSREKAVRIYQEDFIRKTRPVSISTMSSSSSSVVDESFIQADRTDVPMDKSDAKYMVLRRESEITTKLDRKRPHHRRRSSRKSHGSYNSDDPDAIAVSTLIRSLANDAIDHIYDRGKVHIPQTQSRNMLFGVMKKLDDLLSHGGQVIGGYFPITEDGISVTEKEDARQVLAHRMVASYTQAEVHAIMVLWNTVSDTSPRGVVNPYIFNQFRDYFLGYEKYMASSKLQA